jgi:hypothetical protein
VTWPLLVRLVAMKCYLETEGNTLPEGDRGVTDG